MPVVSYRFERSLSAPLTSVRGELLNALDALKFKVRASELTVIEAQRGSRLGGTTLPTKHAPLKARLDLEPAGAGCLVHCSFVDNLYTPFGVMFGVNSIYRKIFEEVRASFDAALARLDPVAARDFAPGEFSAHQPSVGMLEKSNALIASGSEVVVDKANTVLEGGADDGIPDAWEHIEKIRFDGPRGSRVLTMAELQGHLTIAALVADMPGALPENLARELEEFAARIEHALTERGTGEVTITVEEREAPILEFMHQQARIRESVPLRTLHTCHDCKFEKITNPDYERLMQRNQNLRNLMGFVGASVSSSGITPFVVVGTLFKLKRLDPDYVCPRCQGMSAAESIITFCPQCGDLRKEAVLQVCPRCKHDFRRALVREAFWQKLPPPVKKVLAPAAPSGSPPGIPVATVLTPELTPSTISPPAAQPASIPPHVRAPAPEPAVDSKTRVCPTCDALIPDSAAFCMHCGSKMPPLAAPAVCPKCAAQLSPGAHFCGRCGTKLVTPP